MKLQTAAVTTAAVLAVGALAACGTSTPPAPSNAGSTAGSAVASPTPTPAADQHGTAPTPGTPPSTQGYLNCLSDPVRTYDYCQQFDPDPSPSATPAPTPTTPSAGPAQHFKAHLVLVKGPIDISLGTAGVTGCTGGSSGAYGDLGGSTRFVVKTGSVTLASVALGSGRLAANGQCTWNLDLGRFTQQTEYATSLSSGRHTNFTWTLTEMQGKGYEFAVDYNK